MPCFPNCYLLKYLYVNGSYLFVGFISRFIAYVVMNFIFPNCVYIHDSVCLQAVGYIHRIAGSCYIVCFGTGIFIGLAFFSI